MKTSNKQHKSVIGYYFKNKKRIICDGIAEFYGLFFKSDKRNTPTAEQHFLKETQTISMYLFYLLCSRCNLLLKPFYVHKPQSIYGKLPSYCSAHG